MPPITLSDAQREALRLSKVTDAFKRVFGTDDNTRTEIQRIVWRELSLMGYETTPVFVADKDGKIDPIRAAVTDGRRSLLADIKANVNFTPLIEEQQTKKKH